MKRLFKFFRLSSTDRSLLAQAAFTVGAVRVGLWVLSFRTLRRLPARVAQVPARLPKADWSYVDRVAWAVTLVSRYMPAATCLTQALATQVLLGQRGYPVCLRIGVVKDEGGGATGACVVGEWWRGRDRRIRIRTRMVYAAASFGRGDVMSAVVGVYHPDGRPVERTDLERMVEALAH